jgi:hypothetical protein
MRALLHKLRNHLTARAFEEGRFAFVSTPTPSVPPLASCHRRLAALAGFDAIKFDCCINSCICYAPEHYRDLDSCPFCKEPRHNAQGRPRKVFSAVPLIPVLLALVQSKKSSKLMEYRSQFVRSRNGVRDVFDGRRYRKLCKTHVTVNDRRLPHKFFSDGRDIALGLATDGFSPFKKKKATAWPLVLVNYNLPPSIRFRRENLICVGDIPGPKKPKDIDSFLWFLIMELLRLAVGVRAFDGQSQFMLHAYIILGTGDMPAVAMLMHMLGHTGISGCRMCSIRGISDPTKPRSTAHYPALDRSKFPGRPEPSKYDAKKLPLRNHAELMGQARRTQLATGVAERKRLATEFGIKDIPALSFLSSLEFPTSFPLGFMHLLFENVH